MPGLVVTTQVVEQQVVARLAQQRLRALHDRGEEPPAHERHDHADRSGLPAGQAGGAAARRRSPAGGGLQHPAPGLLRDPRQAAQGARHGGRRHPDLARDVLDARHAVASLPGCRAPYGDRMSSHLPDGAHLTSAPRPRRTRSRGRRPPTARPSIWDTFTARPGTISDGSDGSVACASYERLDEDLDLLAGLGVGYYRFSVAWPRMVPDRQRRGRAARAGLLRPAGRRRCSRAASRRWPRSTTGTCRSRSRTRAAGPCARPPSGSPTTRRSCTTTSATGCSLWATLNEPWCSAYLGYAAGMHAPGRREPAPPTALPTTCCWATGWPRPGCTRPASDGVGIVLNLMPVWPERPEAADAADGVDAIQQPGLARSAGRRRVRRAAARVGAAAGRQRGRARRRPRHRAGLGRLARRQLLHAGAGRRGPTATRHAGGVGLDTAAYPGVEGLRFAPRHAPHRDGLGGRAARARGAARRRPRPHRPPSRRHRERRRLRRHDRAADGSVDDQDRIAYLREPHRRCRAGPGRRAPTYAPTSPGRCSTTSSGPRATRRSSGWSRWSLRTPTPDPQGVLRAGTRERARRTPTPGLGLSLDAAGEQAAHEVALQAEEDDHRHDDRDERAGREQVPALPRVPDELGQPHRERRDVGCRRRRPARPAGRSRPRGTGRSPNAAIAGVSSGSITRKKILHVAGAVDPGRLDQLPGISFMKLCSR